MDVWQGTKHATLAAKKKKKKQGVRNDIYGYDMSGLVERI